MEAYTSFSCVILTLLASATSFSWTENSYHGKRLVSSTFYTVGFVGPGMCVMECLRRRSQCKSVNFIKEKLKCELNTANATNGDIIMVDDNKFIFINVTDDNLQNQVRHDPCATTMCGKDRVCSETIDGSTVCVEEQFIDCAEVKEHGAKTDGIYTITLQSSISVYVQCDLTTLGGGWTTILQRYTSRLNFNKNWSDYKAGFSDSISGDHWLGNDVLHLLTKNRLSEVYFSMQVPNGTWYWAKYSSFYVQSEDTKYRLYYNVTSWTGTARASCLCSFTSDIIFRPHLPTDGATTGKREGLTASPGQAGDVHGHRFATFDDDVYTCAGVKQGGWWNNGCSYSYLTALSPIWPGLSTITKSKMMVRAHRNL